jgi:polyhydroxybutyrate depolymerase
VARIVADPTAGRPQPIDPDIQAAPAPADTLAMLMRRSTRTAAALATTVLLAAVPAAGSTRDASMPVPVPDPCAARVAPSTRVLTVEVEGTPRQVVVHLPARTAGAAPQTMVIALHGAGGDGRFMEQYSGFDAISDRDGFVVAYPSAHAATQQWQLHPDPDRSQDDIEFIRSFIDVAITTLCVDPARVDAVGVSNGGAMVARMGCQLSDQLAAIATVAGSYKVIPWCRPVRPLTVLEIHGTADPVVPYRTVAGWLAQWRIHDRCAGDAARSHIAWDADRIQWSCAAGTVVSHVRMYGLGHAWPGSPLDEQGGIVAADKVWDMFAGRTQAPLYR